MFNICFEFVSVIAIPPDLNVTTRFFITLLAVNVRVIISLTFAHIEELELLDFKLTSSSVGSKIFRFDLSKVKVSGMISIMALFPALSVQLFLRVNTLLLFTFKL